MDIYIDGSPFIHMETIATIDIAGCRQLKLRHYIFLSVVDPHFGHLYFLNTDTGLGAGSTKIMSVIAPPKTLAQRDGLGNFSPHFSHIRYVFICFKKQLSYSPFYNLNCYGWLLYYPIHCKQSSLILQISIIHESANAHPI